MARGPEVAFQAANLILMLYHNLSRGTLKLFRGTLEFYGTHFEKHCISALIKFIFKLFLFKNNR